MLKKIGNFMFVAAILILLASPVATLFRQEPTFAVTIRTWSMKPVLTRGDMVFLFPATEKRQFSKGQIIVFRAEEHGIYDWIMHRIVGGDQEQGFITQGDANDYTDQEGSRYPLIQPEWIAGVVPTLGQMPLKIPLLGYIPLLLEQHMYNPFLLAGFMVILAFVLLLGELFKSKKKRRKEVITVEQLFFLGGLAFAVMMAAVMLMGSLFITFPYGVEDRAGVLMGSDVGVIQKGTEKEIVLAELKNTGALPAYYFVTTNDRQIILAQDNYVLSGGEEKKITAVVRGETEGIYQANIIVGMFFSFLPPGLIYALARINFWVALVVVSIVPASPLFVFPFLDYRYRRRLRKRMRKIIPVFGILP
jgi:signal peptidase